MNAHVNVLQHLREEEVKDLDLFVALEQSQHIVLESITCGAPHQALLASASYQPVQRRGKMKIIESLFCRTHASGIERMTRLHPWFLV